jgi:arylsulfatase A-like enzyme
LGTWCIPPADSLAVFVEQGHALLRARQSVVPATPANEFYATDVFNQYALEFIRRGQARRRPWFLFLGQSSPHFPIQAPAERADKYDAVYLRGWDVLREERFDRMKKLGLIDGPGWKLTPRALVPVDHDDIANGFPGKQNSAWDSLDEDRRRDLARRMAVFAAMVETVDQGVGNLVQHLRATGGLDHTLILSLSDNGVQPGRGPVRNQRCGWPVP